MMKKVRYDQMWLTAYESAARYPAIGAAVGLALVALLIPVLTLAGGYKGNLGPSIPLFFLVPMLLASILGGRIAGVVVSLAAVAAWDWFFIPPLHTVTIYEPRDLLALVVFLLDALLTGQLATVARTRAEEAVRRARTSEALYELSTVLIGSHDLTAILSTLMQQLRETFDLQASAILLREPNAPAWHSLATSGSIPDNLNIDRSRDITGVLSWVANTGQVCRLGDDRSQVDSETRLRPAPEGRSRAEFWPLRVGTRPMGVLELIPMPGALFDSQREHLLTTLVNGAALALEQERLFQEEKEATLAQESDRLKSALLTSVSHDLRTPLAGIKAAASSLLQEDIQWSEEDRRAFAADIDAEADHLTRLVSNLLDLSRIEAGAITSDREWEDVGELVQRVVRRLQPRLAAHPIAVDIAPDGPTMYFDTVHMEQVLANLIENAAKYSRDGAPVTVVTRIVPSPGATPHLHLSVTDQGPGIPQDEQHKIFDKFYRSAGTTRRIRGSGMGLAIVKGLVEANGGQVRVESEPGHGSTFTVVLPLTKEQSADEGRPEDTALAPLELPST